MAQRDDKKGQTETVGKEAQEQAGTQMQRTRPIAAEPDGNQEIDAAGNQAFHHRDPTAVTERHLAGQIIVDAPT